MIVIIIENGKVAGVSSDNPSWVGGRSVVINYDTGNTPIPQGNGSTENAQVSNGEIGILFKPVAAFLSGAKREDQFETDQPQRQAGPQKKASAADCEEGSSFNLKQYLTKQANMAYEGSQGYFLAQSRACMNCF